MVISWREQSSTRHVNYTVSYRPLLAVKYTGYWKCGCTCLLSSRTEWVPLHRIVRYIVLRINKLYMYVRITIVYA